MQGSWREGSIVGVPAEQSSWPRVLWLDNTPGDAWVMPNYPGNLLVPFQWHTIDLANGQHWKQPAGQYAGEDNQPNVPADIIAALLCGRLVISNVSGTIWTIYCEFKAPGAPDPAADFIWHVAADAIDGPRGMAFSVVPVIDRKFQVKWGWTGGGSATAAIHATLQGYVRPGSAVPPGQDLSAVIARLEALETFAAQVRAL